MTHHRHVTAHAKTEYGQNFSKLGYTFDGWRQLDYWFDLVIELAKKGKKRIARVVKTRIESFPDEDVFQWSYEAIRQRWDANILEKRATAVTLATPQQVLQIRELLAVVRLPEGVVEKWLAKAGVEDWKDMPAGLLDKCIEYVKNRLPSADAA